MPNTADQERNQERLKLFRAAVESGALSNVRKMINSLHPAEIGRLLESVPSPERELAWALVAPEYEGDTLLYVNDEVRASLIREMETHELVAAAGGLDTDDLADILQDLPDVVIHEVLQSMDAQDRHRLESVLSFGADTAGGLMNTDTITVRPGVTLDVVLRYLRRRGQLPEVTDNLIVVERDDKYLGLLSLTDLVTKPTSLVVSDVMNTNVEGIPATMSAREVSNLFENHDLVSAPVVDDQGRLLGRITIDDVVDVIREQADHSILGLAGLDEEDDLFAPIAVSARHRGVWLGINLLTAFFASWVIGLFEVTLDKIVALAILMPIVASMGGIAGSQTLTLVVRGIALGHVGSANAQRLLTREISISALNGLLWAAVVAVVSGLWFEDYQIGIIIGVAIVVNLMVGALAGALIPMTLRRLGADPAVGGSVVLTTVTDVVGFMVFLGLATILLL